MLGVNGRGFFQSTGNDLYILDVHLAFQGVSDILAPLIGTICVSVFKARSFFRREFPRTPFLMLKWGL